MKPSRGDWDYRYYSHISGKLWFPKHEKTYLQTACYEWEHEKEDVKLGDLGYLVTHGFDLVKFIRGYVKERPNEKTYVLDAILVHLGYLRWGEEVLEPFLYRLYTSHRITFLQLVRLLVAELTLRYEERYNDYPRQPEKVACMKPMPIWDFFTEAEKHHWTKEQMLEYIKLPTDEYLRRLL